MSDTTRTMLYFVKKYFLLVPVFVLFGFSINVHAATGTVDSTEKYAWSNIGGWVNFAPSMSTITITDFDLTGYAWSANNGWVNLSPTDGGVLNDGNGNLSGDAWDQSSGWISFDGVTIDADGYFSGQATGENGYVLNFDCGNCSVRTDWRSNALAQNVGSIITGSKARLNESDPIPNETSEEGIEPVMVPVRSPNYPPEGDVIPVSPPLSITATETPSTSAVEPTSEDKSPLVTTQSSPVRLDRMSDILFWIPFSFFLLLLFVGILLWMKEHRS